MKLLTRAVAVLALASVTLAAEVKSSAKDPKQELLGDLKAGAMAVEAAKAHSFEVWMQNENRTPFNRSGPVFGLGDEIVSNGFLYSTADTDAKPIGTQDFLAVVTSVSNTSERRLITFELDFFDGAWAQKHLVVREKAAAATGLAAADGASSLLITGVETWPRGGGILTKSLTLTVTGGTGSFFGARGQAVIEVVDPPAQVFKFTIVLA